MPAAIETTSPDTPTAVLAWARLCGSIVARHWKTTVRVSPTDTAAFTPAGRWRLAAGDQDAAVVLADERLLRALAHAVHDSMSLPPGAGLLTDVEQGLIDYLSVKLLHAVSEQAPPDMPTLAALDFDGVSVLETSTAMTYTVAVGGISGLLRVEFTDASVQSLPLPATLVDEAGGSVLTAHPVLAVVPLADDEWQHLEPGDAVTLAASTLDGRTVDLHTATGWHAGQGRVVVDTATLLAIELTNATAAMLDFPADVAVVRLAAAVSRPADAAWAAGQRLDFARTAADVVLRRGPASWRGELVRIDGELAVRLLDRLEGGAT